MYEILRRSVKWGISQCKVTYTGKYKESEKRFHTWSSNTSKGMATSSHRRLVFKPLQVTLCRLVNSYWRLGDSASIFRVELHSEDGGTTHLWNVGNYLSRESKHAAQKAARRRRFFYAALTPILFKLQREDGQSYINNCAGHKGSKRFVIPGCWRTTYISKAMSSKLDI